jgi:hypothetical protein
MVAAASALAQAATSGEITPSEASDLSCMVANTAQAIEVAQLDERLQKLEEAVAAKGAWVVTWGAYVPGSSGSSEPSGRRGGYSC